MSNQKLGTVKWFNDSKGYGFITANESKREVFVHYAQIETEGFKSLTEGQRVMFLEESGIKGPQAVSVTVIE